MKKKNKGDFMKIETKQIIEEIIKSLDQLANDKIINIKFVQMFKCKLKQLINEDYEHVSRKVEKYINKKIKNLIKNYYYSYRFKSFIKK